MEEVWRQGDTTVKLIMEALNRATPSPRAYTTYMTVMQRLGDKELLNRTRDGRRDTYVPRISREAYQQARARLQVHDLVSEYGDVALVQFAHELSRLDAARLRRLRSLARGDS